MEPALVASHELKEAISVEDHKLLTNEAYIKYAKEESREIQNQLREKEENILKLEAETDLAEKQMVLIDKEIEIKRQTMRIQSDTVIRFQLDNNAKKERNSKGAENDINETTYKEYAKNYQHIRMVYENSHSLLKEKKNAENENLKCNIALKTLKLQIEEAKKQKIQRREFLRQITNVTIVKFTSDTLNYWKATDLTEQIKVMKIIETETNLLSEMRRIELHIAENEKESFKTPYRIDLQLTTKFRKFNDDERTNMWKERDAFLPTPPHVAPKRSSFVNFPQPESDVLQRIKGRLNQEQEEYQNKLLASNFRKRQLSSGSLCSNSAKILYSQTPPPSPRSRINILSVHSFGNNPAPTTDVMQTENRNEHDLKYLSMTSMQNMHRQVNRQKDNKLTAISSPKITSNFVQFPHQEHQSQVPSQEPMLWKSQNSQINASFNMTPAQVGHNKEINNRMNQIKTVTKTDKTIEQPSTSIFLCQSEENMFSQRISQGSQKNSLSQKQTQQTNNNMIEDHASQSHYSGLQNLWQNRPKINIQNNNQDKENQILTTQPESSINDNFQHTVGKLQHGIVTNPGVLNLKGSKVTTSPFFNKLNTAGMAETFVPMLEATSRPAISPPNDMIQQNPVGQTIKPTQAEMKDNFKQSIQKTQYGGDRTVLQEMTNNAMVPSYFNKLLIPGDGAKANFTLQFGRHATDFIDTQPCSEIFTGGTDQENPLLTSDDPENFREQFTPEPGTDVESGQQHETVPFPPAGFTMNFGQSTDANFYNIFSTNGFQ